MNKKQHHLFCLNFKEYVRTFMKEHELFHPGRKIMVAVSGGVDSVALADILGSFERSISIVHFNHGTRPENVEEEKIVRELAEKLNAELNIFHFEFHLEQKNFEELARKKRQEIYQKFIAEGFWVYTAHHIDDSFEWTLMQSFKQSGLKSTMGIPLFNNGLVRPFLCVTKKQIKRYARARALVWSEDTSNKNLRFERNHLRQIVTGPILKRYPNSLRHYVSRHNQMALMHGVHRLSSKHGLTVTKEESGSVLLVSQTLEAHKAKIKEVIHELSESARGEIDHELDKLLKAHKEMRKDPKAMPFKGPWSFSGGVKAYLVKNHLLLAHERQLVFYKNLDRKLADTLANLAQIPSLAVSLPFPQIVMAKNSKTLHKSSKFIHPLLEVTCAYLKSQDISYTFTPIMAASDRQMLINDAVILDSSIEGIIE